MLGYLRLHAREALFKEFSGPRSRREEHYLFSQCQHRSVLTGSSSVANQGSWVLPIEIEFSIHVSVHFASFSSWQAGDVWGY